MKRNDKRCDDRGDAISPLSGVRVLDFTRHMAGPYATQFLADYGADVIKVEALPHGDGSRRTGTIFYGQESGLFLIWNRGKRSLAVDLRDPAVLDPIRRLVRTVDVVIENFRPGVADSLGIGYAGLAALNPRLIYVSVSAFGKDGPLSDLPGTDPVVQAMSGVMSVTGEPDGAPVLVGVPIADFTGAMVAAQGVMLGLLARDRTGRGQRVDISMLFALMSALTTRLASYRYDGKDPTAHGSSHSVVAPYQAYQTADGWAVAGVWGSGDAWPRFCAAIDRRGLIEDERFADNQRRVANKDALNAVLFPIFRSATTAEWSKRFSDHKALFGPVHKFSEIFSHPQVVDSGMLTRSMHSVLGEVDELAPVIFLSETPGRVTRSAPVLGEHTEEVLREAGLSDDEIAKLLSRGVALSQRQQSAAK